MDVYGVTNAQGETLSKAEINEMLEDLGISDQAIQDGSEDAIEADAEKNNVNLNQLTDMAKKEGANQLSGSADSAKEDYDAELTTLGIPSDVIAKGSSAIQDYADKNGITLPQSTGTTLNLQS